MLLVESGSLTAFVVQPNATIILGFLKSMGEQFHLTFSPQTIYVNASNTTEADRLLREHMSDTLSDWEVKSITETKVLGVLGYKG